MFLTASPFLLVDVYGADPRYLGLSYGAAARGADPGALVASALASRWPARRIVTVGTLQAAGSALVLIAGMLLQHFVIAALAVPMTACAFGGGLVVHDAMIGALTAVRGRVGTAVSIYGAPQMAHWWLLARPLSRRCSSDARLLHCIAKSRKP